MSRAVRTLRAVVVLLALGLAAAGGAGAETAPYALSVNDRIRIMVYGWPALSGDFAIGADGTIALPLAGEIPASGRTAADLGSDIADRLSPLLPARPNVVIEVHSYGPIYVIGAVASPGEYEFTPGMTALMAVARASGALASDTAIEALRLRETLDTLSLKSEGLAISAARLRAERDGAQAIDVAEGARGRRFDSLLADEIALMRMRRDTEDKAVAQLREQQQGYRDEAGSLDRQLAAKEREIEFLNRQLEDQRKLLERGITRESGLLEFQRQLVAAEGDRYGISAFRARALQNISRIEREISERDAARRTEIATSLQVAEAQLAEIRVRSQSAQRMLAALGAPSASGPDGARAYRIHRSGADGAQILDAAESDPIRPGDVVEVVGDQPHGG